MTRPDLHTVADTPERQAAEWFSLRRSGPMGPDDARAFEAWLAQEPEHRAAYDNLEHYWQVADAVRHDPEVLALRDAARRSPGRRWAVGAAIAASLVVVAGWGLTRQAPAPPLLALHQQVFRTAVGQTTSVVLQDGSTVTLDTDSVLKARMSGRERRLELQKGRAFFRVAKDRSRPFVVLAAGRTITATGTAFDVRADPKRFEVILVEGRVRVEDPAPRAILKRQPPQVTEMTPGSQLVAGAGRMTVAPTDVPKETSWLTGRLTFDNEPLSAVVAEMNRYSDRKIVLADASIGHAPILGVFKAGDVEAFVRAVEDYDLARVGSETGETITLVK
jgi:transmembrane sensor